MVDRPHFSRQISPMYPTLCYHATDNYQHKRGLQQTEVPALLQGLAHNEILSDLNRESDPDHLLNHNAHVFHILLVSPSFLYLDS